MMPENHPTLFPNPDDLPSNDEARTFALLLLPIFESEWQRALTSSSPDGAFLLSLHQQMVRLDKGIL